MHRMTLHCRAYNIRLAIVKAAPHVCMKNTAQRGPVLYLPRGTSRVQYPSYTSIGGTLSVILYFLVVLFRATFWSTQIAAIFTHQDVSECL